MVVPGTRLSLDWGGSNSTLLRGRSVQSPSHRSSSGQSEQRSFDSLGQSGPVRTRNHIRHNRTRSGCRCKNSPCICHLEVGHHAKVERRSPSDWVRSLHSTVARGPLLPADPSRYRAADCHRVRVDSLGHVEDRKNKSFCQIGKVACQTESRIRRPSLKVIHGALFAGDGWLLSVSAFLGAVGRVTGLMRGGFETPDFAIVELHISIGRS